MPLRMIRWCGRKQPVEIRFDPRTPTGRKCAAVLATVKVRPCEVRVCGTAGATADLDGVCARRRTDRQVGAKEWFLDRTKEWNRRQSLCQLFVITIREGAPHVA